MYPFFSQHICYISGHTLIRPRVKTCWQTLSDKSLKHCLAICCGRTTLAHIHSRLGTAAVQLSIQVTHCDRRVVLLLLVRAAEWRAVGVVESGGRLRGHGADAAVIVAA